MNEGKKSEEAQRTPAQQAHQPQPSLALNDHDHSPKFAAAPNTQMVISKKANKERQATDESGDDGADGKDGAALDDARFTAGVVKLYETLLKEPIPDEMLRLIDELGKQERE